MTNDEVEAEVENANEEALTADGFEDALIGYVERFGQSPVALYDRDKRIQILMARDEMELVTATEYFDFNTIGAGMGEGTPAFATILRKVL